MSPPPSELSKQYRPAEHEERIFAKWQEAKAFHADPGRVLRGEAQPYCILIPPPNVTDRLHLGHALNNTLQDILARAHRMMGYETLWMPGTDHAGIATQAVVERRLKKEGILKGPLRQSMQRDEFVAHVQAFKDEYEAVITGQLKAMGCSCDWERQRFTMDPVCARAVREAFFRLFKDGLIYRGKRLVNWDPALQTAVADDEVENIEVEGAFYYLRYPLVGGPSLRDGRGGAAQANSHRPVAWDELARAGYPGAAEHPPEQQAWVTVATTRPETYLGDTAVAVSPKDPRAKALRGLFVELPIVGRVIPIIEDDYVVLPSRENPYGKAIGLDRDEDAGTPVSERRATQEDPKAAFATGFLKVTPAHDPNDYELGIRHKLPMINVMAPDASISDKHGWSDHHETAAAHIFLGKKREDARKLVVKEFEARGLLEDTKPYRHTVGHSDRSKAAIEPYLSDQWYVRVTDPRMAASANAALAPEQRAFSAHKKTEGGTGVPPVPGTAATPPSEQRRRSFDPYDRLGPVTENLRTFGRNLPHYQQGGSIYFITFRLAAGELSLEERKLVLDACRHWDGEKMELHAAVVMPDHVHVLISPFFIRPGEWHSTSELLHSIKSFTAHAIGKLRGTGGKVWQDESYDRIIRGRHEFAEKRSYIAQNPVRAGLAEEWDKYPFTWMPEETIGMCYRFVERIFDKRPFQRVPPRALADQEGDFSPGHRRDACATPLVFPEEEVTPESDGSLRFHPERYSRTYETWHDNIRDWCISRQLWWGHRIPVWVADAGGSVQHVVRLRDACTKLADEIGPDDVCVLVDDGGTTYLCARTQAAADALRAVEDCVWNPSGSKEWEDVFPEGYPDLKGVTDELRSVLNDADRDLAGEASFTQDPDVLDTWFSSALWPMSTMGWPDPAAAAAETGVRDFPKLLPAFNPTSTLCTAREIITLWVSRMVMFNRYFRSGEVAEWQSGKVKDGSHSATSPLGHFATSSGPVPFRDVYIHCVVQDGQGRKMSKSLGNGVDPLDIIASHGSDAMRFTICQMATQTQDVRLPVKKDPATGKNTSEKFDLGRNFANKVWNAARFALGILSAGGGPPMGADNPRQLDLADRWMLSRLGAAVAEVESSLKNFEFSAYGQTIYDLLWRDFCDWYLEAIKPTVAEDPRQRAVLAGTLDTIIRLLHPVMPFVTEAIFERVREVSVGPVAGLTLGMARPHGPELLALAAWPRVDSSLRDEEAEKEFEWLRGLITAIREVRAKHNVHPRRRATLHAPLDQLHTVKASQTLVVTLAGLGAVTDEKPKGPAIEFTYEGEEYRLSDVAEAVDADAEKTRLTKLIGDLEKSETTLGNRLANPGYSEKAPPAMVQQSRDQLDKIRAELAAARKAFEAI